MELKTSIHDMNEIVITRISCTEKIAKIKRSEKFLFAVSGQFSWQSVYLLTRGDLRDNLKRVVTLFYAERIPWKEQHAVGIFLSL